MERVLGELISGLLSEGHQVTVISRSCALPAHHRLTWVRVPGPARPFPLAYPWFFLAGSLLTVRHRCGTLLTTGAVVANRADWSVVHLCHHAIRELGTLRTSRRTPSYRFNAILARWLSRLGERFCYSPRRCDGLIAVSHGVAAEIARYFPQMPVTVIPNGVSIERFQPDNLRRDSIRNRYGIADGDLLALFVGSEWEGKGLRSAIEALAHIDGWKLLVVGRGDFDGYRELAKARGVFHRVLFAGVIDDPAPFYCASDAFLLPSIYETFSLVTYEAAACGIPLLVTPVSGVTDLLVEGTNGWFIQPDPADIASKLMKLGHNPALRARMGLAARRAALDFSWSCTVTSYQRLFERSGTTDSRATTRSMAQPRS